jgi:hypothetical protein
MQDQLTTRLNVLGIPIDQTMISKIQSQTREVGDYEVQAIADVLDLL